MCKWYGTVEDKDLFYDETDISIPLEWIEDDEQDGDEVVEFYIIPPRISEV